MVLPLLANLDSAVFQVGRVPWGLVKEVSVRLQGQQAGVGKGAPWGRLPPAAPPHLRGPSLRPVGPAGGGPRGTEPRLHFISPAAAVSLVCLVNSRNEGGESPGWLSHSCR